MSRAPVHCDYKGACTVFMRTMAVFNHDVRRIMMGTQQTPAGIAANLKRARRYGKGYIAPYRGQPGPPIGPRGYILPPELEAVWRDLRASGRTSAAAARDLHLKPME